MSLSISQFSCPSLLYHASKELDAGFNYFKNDSRLLQDATSLEQIQKMILVLFRNRSAAPYWESLQIIDSEISQLLSAHSFSRYSSQSSSSQSSKKPRLQLCDQQGEKELRSMKLARDIFGKVRWNSTGNFKYLAGTFDLTLSFLSNHELGYVARASQECKNRVYACGNWNNQVTTLDIGNEQIANRLTSREAVKAHRHFCRTLYQFITDRSNAPEIRSIDDSLWAKSDCIPKFKSCLEQGLGQLRNRCTLDLSESGITLVPGWVWPFFPQVTYLFLNDNQIKTLPSEIFQLNLEVLNCSNNQLTTLPALRPRSLTRLYLAGNPQFQGPERDNEAPRFLPTPLERSPNHSTLFAIIEAMGGEK